jgi:hypothetical protein
MNNVEATQTRRRGLAYEASTEQAAGWIRLGAWAGLAGPVLFTAAFLGQEILHAGEYSPIAQPVHELEAELNGWVQQINFVVLGLSTMAFAVGLHLGVRPTRTGIAGPALLLISGTAAFVASIFAVREGPGGVTYPPLDVVAGGIFFFSSAIGLTVLSRRLAHDPRWRALATYTLLAGIVAVSSAVVMALFVIPDNASLHDWAGLAQRVLLLAVLFPCRMVLSFRLLRIVRDGR